MSSRKTARVHQGSFAARLLEYFRANPDEELTYQDIADKFGVPIRSARSRVTDLTRAGAAIESVHIIRLKAKGRSLSSSPCTSQSRAAARSRR